MSNRLRPSSRWFWPAATFLLVATAHFVWSNLFPDRDPAQSAWLSVAQLAPRTSWLARYLDTESYWLGYSYAASLAFATAAFLKYRRERHCAARNLAIGGVTLSGFLGVAACFLVGCCGSPMLVVYLSLFGAGFLPFAKPAVAGLTTLMLIGSWVWLSRIIARGNASSLCGDIDECRGSPAVEARDRP